MSVSLLEEVCEICNRETEHEVSVQILEEGVGDGAQYSREPYRVKECQRCGEKTRKRMNNA